MRALIWVLLITNLSQAFIAMVRLVASDHPSTQQVVRVWGDWFIFIGGVAMVVAMIALLIIEGD